MIGDDVLQEPEGRAGSDEGGCVVDGGVGDGSSGGGSGSGACWM